MERLGDLQLRILRVLWRTGEGTVAQVQQHLARDGTVLAYTTVATMLAKMERRGLVTHRVEGRRYVYRPLVSEQEVSERMTSYVLDRLFEGSLSQMVSHLLSRREISAQELDQLERLIRHMRRRCKR